MQCPLRILALSLLAMLSAAPGAFAAPSSVTIVYVADMADVGESAGGSGYPALATLIKELRDSKTPVLLFHGGNVLGYSALSSYDSGAHIIGILNSLQPEVLGLGRRDFMHKEDELALRTDEAVFPIVCSNIYDPISLAPPGNSKAGHIFQTPIPIGFLALVSSEMQTTYIQRRLVLIGGQELLPKLGAALKRDGARFLTATTDFMPNNAQDVLAESGLDLLFISGAPATGLAVYEGRGLATHSGNGDDVLLVRLEPDSKGGLSISGYEVRHLKDYVPNPEMKNVIDRYTKIFNKLSKAEVGRTNVVLDTRREILCKGENAMGNLVADSMRDYYGADVALMNSGGIRGDRIYEAGTALRRGDLQKEMPLHDMSCLVNVRGSSILDALEHGLSRVEQASGRFLHVSGMEYRYDPSVPPGSRVVSVSIGGSPLDPDKIYAVSLPEYLSAHGDGFYMFPGECVSKVIRPQQEIVEIVRVYFALNNPVSPRIEGRIKSIRPVE